MDIKETASEIVYFLKENKLWVTPLAIILALCIFVFGLSAVANNNKKYIASEFTYAEEAKNNENYDEALNHINNILEKDETNQQALKLKDELEILIKDKKVSDYLNKAIQYKNEGNYISAYDCITSALNLDSENTEAIKLKDEILPLYQTQKQQKEEEAKAAAEQKKAEEEAKKAQQKAEEEAHTAEKIKKAKTLADTYVFDGELAVKILEANHGFTSYSYMYGQMSNDADGNFYPVAYKISEYSSDWSFVNVYENGTVKDIYNKDKSIKGYTKAVGSASVSKADKAKQEAEAKVQAEAKAKQEAEAKAKAEADAKAEAQARQQSAAMDKRGYMNSCIDIDGGSLLRNPSQYRNKRICVTGTVISQVTLQKNKVDSALEDLGISGSENMEAVIVEDSEGYIAVMYNPDSIGMRLLEGDYVSVYGEFIDLTDMTSTNFYGTQSEYKMPKMEAKYID